MLFINNHIGFVRTILKGGIYKGISILLNFLCIGIIINSLGAAEYGIWAILLTIYNWIYQFDFGVGANLRNQIASNQNINSSLKNSYGKLFKIVIYGNVINFSLWLSNSYYLIFSIPQKYSLSCFMMITLSSFLLFLGLINNVLLAKHQSERFYLLQALNFMLIAIFLYTLSTITKNLTIELLILIYTVPNIIILSTVTVLMLKKLNVNFFIQKARYKEKNLSKKELQFLILQISAIILFLTDRIFIARFFTLEDVSKYDLLNKFYNIFILGQSLILLPLWSKITEYYSHSLFEKLRDIIKNQILIFVLICSTLPFLGLYIDQIISFWSNGNVKEIGNSLIVSVSVLTLITLWNNIFAYFSNATSILTAQTYCAVLAIILNVILSIYLSIEYNSLGFKVILWSSILALIPYALVGPIETFFFLKNNSNKTV